LKADCVGQQQRQADQGPNRNGRSLRIEYRGLAATLLFQEFPQMRDAQLERRLAYGGQQVRSRHGLAQRRARSQPSGFHQRGRKIEGRGTAGQGGFIGGDSEALVQAASVWRKLLIQRGVRDFQEKLLEIVEGPHVRDFVGQRGGEFFRSQRPGKAAATKIRGRKIPTHRHQRP